MDRVQALIELKARLKNENKLMHSLAVEAIMRKLASRLKGDAETWGIVGLLHDIDCDRTADEPEKHSLVGAEILENIGLDEDIVYAVRAHNPIHGIERKRKMDKALFCADAVSGFIKAYALARPSGKLSDVTAGFVMEKMDDGSFAKDIDRDRIRSCGGLGLPLDEFIGIALASMGEISDQLGL